MSKRMSQLVEDLIEQGEALDVHAGQLEQRNRNLEDAHVMDRALLSDLSAKLQRQQEILDDAIEIAGHMSVLFPAIGELKAHGQRHGRETYEVNIHQRIDPSEFLSVPPRSFTMQVESLKLLIAKVRQDHLSRAVHAHVKFADGEFAYGASQAAVCSMPRSQLLRTITNELGRALVDELSKARL